MLSLKYYISKLIKKSKLSSVKNSVIDKTSKIESGTLFINSTMGKYSFCGYDCDIVNTTIGSYCSIANDVVIGGGEHPVKWVSTSPVFYSGRDSVKEKFAEFERSPIKQTIIGHDVWIGRNVTIKQGVKIGTGSVIGMGSVVTKDIDAYAIVGGNPAKLIRYRFDEDVCERLIISEWWNLSKDSLFQLSQYIKNPTLFLEKLEANKQ